MRWLSLLLLVGCAHSRATKSVGRPALDGIWQLTDVRCDKGPLGQLGANIAVSIHTRATDERYEVDDGAFTWRVRERQNGGSQDSFCETLLTGTWDADGKTLTTSGATFKSRRGVGGYKCYEPFQHPKAEGLIGHAYELNAKGLVLHHKNPTVKVGNRLVKGCEQDDAQLLYIFAKQ